MIFCIPTTHIKRYKIATCPILTAGGFNHLFTCGTSLEGSSTIGSTGMLPTVHLANTPANPTCRFGTIRADILHVYRASAGSSTSNRESWCRFHMQPQNILRDMAFPSCLCRAKFLLTRGIDPRWHIYPVGRRIKKEILSRFDLRLPGFSRNPLEKLRNWVSRAAKGLSLGVTCCRVPQAMAVSWAGESKHGPCAPCIPVQP
ncbi:uncharacterized protein F4822DRAFT_252345 [Hypoxylon trugodes]|uniref:uncharacterized protein n=1 Tax=Hypoxylon trugodes TaxID=326681 RepID=UPI00219815CF|nr:uncharacterized protein F4822DRAFT_252345 [Hypoxylon trugodes]KAI1388644.1 hypothetical protein F4822DRAFT_252345 [Hypoxylon trugodes]